MWFLLVSLAQATPSAEALRSAWNIHADAIAAHSSVPVALEPEDFETLARGKAVTRRQDAADGTYATGAIWADAPVMAPWIVISDAPHAPPSPATTERLPIEKPPGFRTVYMHLDLPWPFKDRQWVSELAPNRELHALDPQVWQRTWTNGDPALADHPDPDAVWMDRNNGAWTMVDAGDGTLVIFSVRTVLGGAIPAGMSQGVALLGLATTLERIAILAPTMRTHYDAAHEVIYAPDGTGITPWGD